MKLPLKYFLIICLLLGTIVTPYAYREYLEWQKRREGKAQLIALKFVSADAVAEVLRQLFPDQLKPAAGSSTPELSLVVDAPTNSLIIAAPKALFKEVEKVIQAIDQNGAQKPRQIVIPASGETLEEVKRVLEEMFQPATDDHRWLLS